MVRCIRVKMKKSNYFIKLPMPCKDNARQIPNYSVPSNLNFCAHIFRKEQFNLRYILPLIMLCTVMEAFGQDKHGTIILIAASNDKIVVAADSRITLVGQKYFDDECKVIRLEGDIAFAAAGRRGHISGGHQEFTWQSNTIAVEIAKGTVATSNRVQDIAVRWAERVTALHNRDAARGVISESISKNPLESAIFAGFDGGKPTAYQIAISQNPIDPHSYIKETRELNLRDGTIIPLGTVDICLEFFSETTERGKAWFAEFNAEYGATISWNAAIIPLFQRIIDLSMAHSVGKKDLGGPIDILEIRRTGICWPQKKKNCPE